MVASVIGSSEDGSFQLRSAVQRVTFGASFLGQGPLLHDEITLLNFALSSDEGQFWASQMDDSHWFQRAASPLSGIRRVRELCAGLGCMGCGASFAGFEVVTAVELQSNTCEVLKLNTKAGVVLGDLCSPEVENPAASHLVLLATATPSKTIGPAPCQVPVGCSLVSGPICFA